MRVGGVVATAGRHPRPVRASGGLPLRTGTEPGVYYRLHETVGYPISTDFILFRVYS